MRKRCALPSGLCLPKLSATKPICSGSFRAVEVEETSPLGNRLRPGSLQSKKNFGRICHSFALIMECSLRRKRTMRRTCIGHTDAVVPAPLLNGSCRASQLNGSAAKSKKLPPRAQNLFLSVRTSDRNSATIYAIQFGNMSSPLAGRSRGLQV